MREIKYRAWNGEWFDYTGLSCSKHTPGPYWKTDSIRDCENMLNGKECIIEQYTGLNDKNGKEIYEGDIVAWTVNAVKPIGEVYYTSGCFDLRSPSRGSIGWDALRGEAEIIGNIHEDSALL